MRLKDLKEILQEGVALGRELEMSLGESLREIHNLSSSTTDTIENLLDLLVQKEELFENNDEFSEVLDELASVKETLEEFLDNTDYYQGFEDLSEEINMIKKRTPTEEIVLTIDDLVDKLESIETIYEFWHSLEVDGLNQIKESIENLYSTLSETLLEELDNLINEENEEDRLFYRQVEKEINNLKEVLPAWSELELYLPEVTIYKQIVDIKDELIQIRNELEGMHPSL